MVAKKKAGFRDFLKNDFAYAYTAEASVIASSCAERAISGWPWTSKVKLVDEGNHIHLYLYAHHKPKPGLGGLGSDVSLNCDLTVCVDDELIVRLLDGDLKPTHLLGGRGVVTDDSLAHGICSALRDSFRVTTQISVSTMLRNSVSALVHAQCYRELAMFGLQLEAMLKEWNWPMGHAKRLIKIWRDVPFSKEYSVLWKELIREEKAKG